MIRLEHVSKSYESKRVFQDLNAAFSLNQSYLLIGASGAGKTTLLRLLAGLEEPETGRIIRPEGLRIRLVFQEDRLSESFSAVSNIRLVTGNRLSVGFRQYGVYSAGNPAHGSICITSASG